MCTAGPTSFHAESAWVHRCLQALSRRLQILMCACQDACCITRLQRH